MAVPRKKCGFLIIKGKKIFIYEGVNIIGRKKEAVVILKDPVASQHHAIITIINDSHYISDLKSTNGTKLNNTNLSPYQLYSLEENDEIEFTPSYKGKYSKLQFTASQSSNLTQTQNESQMTQFEDGFYNVDTQIHPQEEYLFNDDCDNDISNLVINTQVINTSISSINQQIASIHDQVTQQICFNSANINDVATQIITDTPSYLGDNKTLTKHSVRFSPRDAIIPEDVAEKEEVPVEVSINDMETQAITSDSPLVLQEENLAPTNNETETQNIYEEATNKQSTYETTTVLESREQQPTLINSEPKVLDTNESTTVVLVTNEEDLSNGRNNLEAENNNTNQNDLPTTRADSPSHEKETECDNENHRANTPEATATAVADSESMATQSLTPIRYSKRSINPLDSDSEPETDLPRNLTDDIEQNANEDCSEFMKPAKIANLSTQTVTFDQDSQLSHQTKRSSISKNIQEDSDDSIDLLFGHKVELPEGSAQARPSSNASHTSEFAELEKIKMKFKNKLAKQNSQSSADIVSDSDSDDIFDVQPSPLKNSTFRQSSGGNKSKFVLSDSEESDNDVQDLKVNAEPKVIANDTISDFDDSTVQRKSFGDISQACIPSTQQETSFQPRGSDSFKLELSHIGEITEFSKLSDKSTNEELDKTASQAFESNIAGTQEDPVTHPSNPVDSSMTSCDFLAPTQPLVSQKLRSTEIGKELTECDFDAATQKIDEDFDFLAPTQRIIEKPKEVDDYVFAAPTQPVRKKQSVKSSSELDDCDFEAATQPFHNEPAPVDAEDLFDVATQPLRLPETLKDDLATILTIPIPHSTESSIPTNITQTDEYGDFETPTQPLECRKPIENVNSNKLNEVITENIDFEADTQQITEQSPTGKDNLAYTEAETQNVEDLQPLVIIQKTPEIESQLEVMFQSQNVSVTSNSRPSNPMASFLDSSSTQDVIEMLSGAGTKRTSDEFENVNETKRVKTTHQEDINETKRVKTTPQSTGRTTRSRQSETNKSKSAKKESKTPSVLDLWEKEKSSNANSKTVSKLSTIKLKQVSFAESDDGLSDNEVECLADTIPIKTRESVEISKQENEMRLKDISEMENRTEKTSKGGETVVSKQSLDENSIETPNCKPVRRRRQLLDDESLCIVTDEVATPESVQRQVNNVYKKVDESKEEVPPKRITRGRKKVQKEEVNDSESKGINVGRTTRTRETKLPRKKLEDSFDEDKVEEMEDDSKTNGKRVTRNTRNNAKALQNDISKGTTRRGRGKAIPPSSRSDDSDDENVEDIKIRVPRKQMKLYTAEEDNVGQKDISTIVEESLQDKPKRRRAVKSKEEVLPTPERIKRATKPKIVFTMLNDPQLNTIVRSLGGVIVDSMEASTVLVTKKVQRTLKLLSAIGNSIPICSPDWLYECKRAQKFLDPWDHLLHDSEAEDQWKFRINESYERSKKGKLFADYQFYLLVNMSADVIKGAIEANGGKIVTRKTPSEHLIVVAGTNQKNKYELFLKNKVMVVSAEAVLVSVLRQEIVFKEFLLH